MQANPILLAAASPPTKASVRKTMLEHNVTVPLLVTTSVYGSHTALSGYGALATHLQPQHLVTEPRTQPHDLAGRAWTWLLTRGSFCRWYRPSSSKMEWRAYRLLRSGFTGIVHVFWADHDLGYLDVISKRTRTPICGTFHNCDDTLPENLRFPARLRQLAAIILMSETQRAFFQDRGVPPERIHVIHHGVDTDFFRPPLARESEPFTALSVGSYRRNFSLLADICRALVDVSAIRFRIVAAPHFASLFDGLPNVAFLSGITDEQLLAEYQRASCFIATAENCTANNALVEAMACGLPVVGERVGGIPEYVNETCSVLVKKNSREEMVQALQALANDPRRRSEMGARSQARASDLDWRNVAKKTESVYSNLSERRSTAA